MTRLIIAFMILVASIMLMFWVLAGIKILSGSSVPNDAWYAAESECWEKGGTYKQVSKTNWECKFRK